MRGVIIRHPGRIDSYGAHLARVERQTQRIELRVGRRLVGESVGVRGGRRGRGRSRDRARVPPTPTPEPSPPLPLLLTILRITYNLLLTTYYVRRTWLERVSMPVMRTPMCVRTWFEVGVMQPVRDHVQVCTLG